MEDLCGQKFTYLTVIKRVPNKVTSGGSQQVCYECLCDCGKTTIITKGHLITGHTKSCGCAKTKLCQERTIKHGQAGSRLYHTYYHMRRRCFNPKDKEYHRYGQRGITVCDEWLGKNGFKNFYNWAITHGYQEDLTIDRINNDGNYEPSNCRWATNQQQMNNVSYNVRLTHNNETHTIAEWSRILGLKQDTIQARIKYYGLSIEDALFKPPTCKKQVAIYKDGNLIQIFDSQKAAANYIQVDTAIMSMYLNGKIHSLNGYHAERVNQYERNP